MNGIKSWIGQQYCKHH